VREGAVKVRGDARRCHEGVRCRKGAKGRRNVPWRFERVREGVAKVRECEKIPRGCEKVP
jgi:hypothetical protein